MAKYTYTVLCHYGVHDPEQFPNRKTDLSKESTRFFLEDWLDNCEDGASLTFFCYEDVFDKETGEQINEETGEVRE